MIQASNAYKNAMFGDAATTYVRLQLLDSNENVLQNIDTYAIDGSIDVDKDRASRRKFTARLDNSDGSFTWNAGGTIWINKKVKLFIGFNTGSQIEYAPQGVFMLSAPTASSKADGTREATLQGDDKWHQFDGKPLGTFQNPVTVTSGTNVASAIQTLAQQFGETKFNFDSCSVTVPYTLTYQPGEAVGKAITELANLAVWTCFYDVNGYLRFRPINQNLTSSPSVQTYDKNDAFTIYAGADKTFDESKLFNKVLVLGGSSTTALVSATSTNSDANSPISTANIGTRLFVYNNGSPDPLITTTALAQSRADYELQQRNRIVETQKFSALPNFLHEAEDIVTIYDDWTSTNGNYQLTKFTIPLQPGQLMTGDVWRVTGVGS